MKIKIVLWYRLIDENILIDDKVRIGYNRVLLICQDFFIFVNMNCFGVGGGGIFLFSKCW